MSLLYDDDSASMKRDKARGVRGQDYGHNTDAHNLRLLQSDQRLMRILRAYSRCDEAGREALLAQSGIALADSLLREGTLPEG